jgi:hypothetical protein
LLPTLLNPSPNQKPPEPSVNGRLPDQMIYQFYGLTPEEIAIVEGQA